VQVTQGVTNQRCEVRLLGLAFPGGRHTVHSGFHPYFPVPGQSWADYIPSLRPQP
jgi:hypothetical protein